MDNAQYFYRNITFTRNNDQVSVVDINEPDNVTPLDEWLGIVVSLADGQHTIQELLEYMRTRYQMPPENLDKTLLSVIERLEDGKIVLLSKEAVTLPYYLSLPIEELDIEKAKKLIQEDSQKGAQ